MAEHPRPDAPAINGKFGFSDPMHLLAKLTFDLDAMERSHPGEHFDRVFHTMNFLISAWQMCDWVWEASTTEQRQKWAGELIGIEGWSIQGRKDFRQRVKGRSIYMRVCAAVANELKHFNPSSEGTTDFLVDSWAMARHRIQGDNASPRDWVGQFRFHDQLIDDVDLCRGILSFWALSFARVGLLAETLASDILRQCGRKG